MDNFKENRSFHDRRKFTYTAHSPERRSGMDKRALNANKLKVRAA